ncbi:MAG TPA: Ig-like domain-containing protein [Thermoleophilaceae bacterium]|jgi:hypothetical protein
MAPTPLTHTLGGGRGGILTLASALCLALLLAIAAPASAVTHKRAAKKAVAALGSSHASGAVVVLGLPKPLRAGTLVTQQGKKKVVARVGRERAFFYYEDAAPLQPFPHAGRVALVGVKSGKVRLTRALTRRPLLNGRLPAFLKSVRAYKNEGYVVYDSSTKLSAPAPQAPPVGSETTTQQDPFPIEPVGVNRRPTAFDQNVAAKLNSPKHIILTGSDPDTAPGGDSEGTLLTFAVTKLPNHGSLSGQPPSLTYTPDPGWSGPDHFFFKVNDGDLDSKEGKVSINVVALGAPPVVTTSTGCTEYLEQTAGVAIDGQLTASDPDDTVLDSAVVRIASGLEGGDNLLFTDQNGITGAYDERTGQLDLVGTASVATYQAALRTVRYQNLSSGTPAASKGIAFTVNDAGSDSAPATKEVCITEAGGPNNRPVGETSEGVLDYIENDGAVSVDPGFFVLDPDSSQLSGATVRFTVSQPPEDDNGNPIGSPVNNFAPDEDDLAFTDQNGITGAYDDSTGVLTLSGLASVADYEAAMRSVTYENSSEDPSPAPRTLRFQVKDASGLNSVASNRGVLVTPVNDAPTATPSEGASSYTEDEPASAVDSQLDIGDVDNDQLQGAQVKIASGLQSGDELAFEDQLGITGSYDAETTVLTLTGTASVDDYETALRSVTFRHVGDDPDPARSVEIVVNDGELDSATATKEIAVTPVNDAPVATTGAGSTAYTENDPATTIDTAVALSDVDDDQLEGAQVKIASGFQPGDELAFVDQLGITGEYDTTTGVLTLTGTAPIGDYETALRSVGFSSFDDDPVASKTVEFTVNDGDDDSAAASREIAVTPVNDPPVVSTSDGSTEYEIGGPGVAVDPQLTVSDPDDTSIASAEVTISGFEAGDELVFVDQLGITGTYDTETGVLSLTGTASVGDYEAALRSIEFGTTNETPSASRSIGFTVNDGDAGSAAASRAIDLVEANDAPVVTTTTGDSTYTLGDSAGVVVDDLLTVTDGDDTNLESAVVRIQGGEPGDELVFTDQAGITGTIDETGFLILTGTASAADYETALRSVRFRNTTATEAGTRTLEFQVNDGRDDSATATKGVALVAAPPPAP